MENNEYTIFLNKLNKSSDFITKNSLLKNENLKIIYSEIKKEKTYLSLYNDNFEKLNNTLYKTFNDQINNILIQLSLSDNYYINKPVFGNISFSISLSNTYIYNLLNGYNKIILEYFRQNFKSYNLKISVDLENKLITINQIIEKDYNNFISNLIKNITNNLSNKKCYSFKYSFKIGLYKQLEFIFKKILNDKSYKNPKLEYLLYERNINNSIINELYDLDNKNNLFLVKINNYIKKSAIEIGKYLENNYDYGNFCLQII